MKEAQLTPRERRALRTRGAILDAARQIISKQGVEALSIRGIANAIDYSPAGLYEYFGSKEEIMMAVVTQGFERFTCALESVDPTLPALTYIVEVGLVYINFAVDNPDFFLLMFTTAPLSDLNQAEHNEAYDTASAAAFLLQEPSFAILHNAVKRCVDEGLFHIHSGYGILDMALTTWGHVHGMAMLRVTYFRNSSADFTTVDRDGLVLLFRGFAVEPSAVNDH